MAKKLPTVKTGDMRPKEETAAHGICRKCGVSITDLNGVSVNSEGKITCAECLGKQPGKLSTLADAQKSLAASLEANSAPKADASKAPKAPETPAEAPKPAPTKVAPKATKRAAEKALNAEKADATRKEWELITGLAAEGKDRSAIAKEAGVSYSRVTFILWHKQYGLAGIPGMPEYTKEAKAEAQKRYLADVAARKAAKAEG